MTPIVLELQKLASEDSHSATELLRKALLVASKLTLSDFAEWVNKELNGYGNTGVPAYRRIRAELKVDNPYRGLCPFIVPHEIADKICDVEVTEPIGGLAFRRSPVRSRSAPPRKSKDLRRRSRVGLVVLFAVCAQPATIFQPHFVLHRVFIAKTYPSTQFRTRDRLRRIVI